MTLINKLKCSDLNILHKSFEIGLILKGFNGILEIAGGSLLIFLNPLKLNKLILLLTQNELSESPKDFLCTLLLNFNSTFSISMQHFGIIYLISHGAIKLFLVILLWNKKAWAYPLTIAFLSMFIIYQIYHYLISHSAVLILLTIFDTIMIFLTFIEYKGMKKENNRKLTHGLASSN